MARRRTLLCVLDWGLGHATRSLALTDHPLLEGDELIVASSGRAAELIRRERPGWKVVELPAYRVRYPTRNMPANVALQLPKWMVVIYREHLRTQALVREHRIDRIVSDNRFGCYSRRVPSIFLTHQLHPITGSRLVNKIYHAYLRRYDEFWVPDDPGSPLSGALSSAEGYDNVQYIGPLSRFSPPAIPPVEAVDLLVLLSGPEPMRTRLERSLLRSLNAGMGRVVVVRGVFNGAPLTLPPNVTLYDFAGTATLARLFSRARCIICRPGYSTLMDLAAAKTGANLIYVPTPGQTEQAYLARAQVRLAGEGAAIGGGRANWVKQGEVGGQAFQQLLQSRLSERSNNL